MTDRLIERLVAEAGPVRRLWPPAVRAALWLGSIAALGALAIAVLGKTARLELVMGDPRLLLETVAISDTSTSAARGGPWLARLTLAISETTLS